MAPLHLFLASVLSLIICVSYPVTSSPLSLSLSSLRSLNESRSWSLESRPQEARYGFSSVLLADNPLVSTDVELYARVHIQCVPYNDIERLYVGYTPGLQTPQRKAALAGRAARVKREAAAARHSPSHQGEGEGGRTSVRIKLNHN